MKEMDSIPKDWFTTKRKQVFIDSGIKVYIVSACSRGGSMEELREILERCDPTWQAIDCVDAQIGQTLLHLAITQSRDDLSQLLLEFKPNVEAPSRIRRTLIEAATTVREALIVELLLVRRACTNRSPALKLSPIHLAVEEGHVEVLRLLLIKGAGVDALTDDGCTTLHIAVEERRRDYARLLLASGTHPDIRSTDSGNTALHIAAGLGDDQMVKIVLQKGTNKDISNQMGNVAAKNLHSHLYDALCLGDSLCAAVRKGEIHTIHRLIENGALVNVRDLHGWTALHRAAFKVQIDAVRTPQGLS